MGWWVENSEPIDRERIWKHKSLFHRSKGIAYCSRCGKVIEDLECIVRDNDYRGIDVYHEHCYVAKTIKGE